MRKKAISLLLSLTLLLSNSGFVLAANYENVTSIILSDTSITVDGQIISTDPTDSVYIGADIVYYEDGHDSSYGEGTSDDAHSALEASEHTVVTITKAGIYRLSGTLSAGQIAIDLGEDAKDNPNEKVTLILDGVDITCTVAPAIIFYNVYEPYSDTEDTKGITDLTNAGAQVILTDDSINHVQGSYVARIYKAGTTKKLHKYDGAFYSKMSLNISGEEKGNGELHITAENEGLDSELHLTINGGNIYIQAQNDGINTNEDNISVTTINGGYLYVNAGLGQEGDGIDSNGYITINGGTIIAMSNEKSPDGGIDADKDITINGGTVIALGTRNDATSQASTQPYMELSFASTQTKGSIITIKDTEGHILLNQIAEKTFQSLTFSSDELALNTAYHLYINGIQQQYTGNSTGMMGVFQQGGFRPENLPDGTNLPMNNLFQEDAFKERMDNGRNELIGGMNRQAEIPNGDQKNQLEEGSLDFILTENTRNFSGVSETLEASNKSKVTFTVNQGKGITSVASGETISITDITSNLDVPFSDIQITITDVPSENYVEYCFLSDGKESLANIFPADDGTYQLTIAVVSSNTEYTGVSQWQFTIGGDGLPFADISPQDSYYNAVKYLYETGIMVGTSEDTFSPNEPVTRAMAITVLARILEVEGSETNNFTDIPSGQWYSSYVGWAASNQLVVGDGKGNFLPNNIITSTQLDLILSRYSILSGIEYQPSNTPEKDLTRGELAEILILLK